MHTARGARISALAITMLVAACGSSTPPAATQGGGGATTVPATQAGGGATQPPAATQAGGNGGGEFTGGPCSLLSTDEVAGVLGGSGWTAQETPMAGGSGGCIFESGDSLNIAAISVTSGVNTPTLWAVYSNLPATEIQQVSGIGDSAVWVTSSDTLFVLKGQTLVGVNAGTGEAADADRLAWAKSLGGIVFGHL